MIPYSNIFGRLGNNLFQGAYLYAQVLKGELPDIYVQDPTYFQDYAKEVKKLYGGGIGRIDQVAIHVRRGDYVNNSFYVDLMETEYYEKAMELFPDCDFLVFSDDITWCKEQSIFLGCEFSEETDEVKDLNLMASCTGHIIANSSFSWWGAYLSPHEGKVVAPKQWYSDRVERTMCPPEWIKL